MTSRMLLIAVMAVGLTWVSAGSAAPKPKDPPTAKQEKAVKEFVGLVLAAIGQHDIEALTGLCDVPFNIQRSSAGTSGIRNNLKDLKSHLRAGLGGQPRFDGSKHEIKSIQTYKSARGQFDKQDAADADAVLDEKGLVAHVEVDYAPEKSQWRLLIKLKEGQPRLVGIQLAPE